MQGASSWDDLFSRVSRNRGQPTTHTTGVIVGPVPTSAAGHRPLAGVQRGCTIIVAFFVNKKKDGVANAYAALHEALSKEGTDQEGEEDKVQEEKRNALQSIIESYSSTPAAIDARFQLAKIEYQGIRSSS